MAKLHASKNQLGSPSCSLTLLRFQCSHFTRERFFCYEPNKEQETGKFLTSFLGNLVQKSQAAHTSENGQVFPWHTSEEKYNTLSLHTNARGPTSNYCRNSSSVTFSISLLSTLHGAITATILEDTMRKEVKNTADKHNHRQCVLWIRFSLHQFKMRGKRKGLA